MEVRYDRQQRIKNWNQEILGRSEVMVVGNGNLAHSTSSSLASLGVGTIVLYDPLESNEGFLCGGEYKGRTLQERLSEMNPKIKVVSVSDGKLRGFNPNLVIELTNSLEVKDDVAKYALGRDFRLITASATDTRGEMQVVDSEDFDVSQFRRYEGKHQGALISELFGGAIPEEARKILMPLKEGEMPVRSLSYNIANARRFARASEFDASPYEDLSGKKVLVVGAGALGNFASLGAVREGMTNMDIMDFDEVELHNLNRQFLFYDSVGEKKALALAKKLRALSPGANVKGLVGKVDEECRYFDSNKPDLILDCVDSFASRAFINYFALRHGIPLVSGGTNAISGQVVVYEPGSSACINCKLGVDAALARRLLGSKCTNEPDPSVITVNRTVGGMMAGESLKVLDKGYGTPVTRILKYDSTHPSRGGLVGPDASCDCQSTIGRMSMSEWLNFIKEKYASLVQPEA